MKNKNNKIEITRKEALQRMGKYAALTAVGTFLILNPKKAQAQSPTPDDPLDPGGGLFD
ncbi:hypothetical protein [Gelidibacter pelagius]|uniref:Secreted protein n=1 Tax=Gelidibacter pelagius TaxID=2819985 RepID=A0ABS3SX10_9FLAO|nr:hypothetical protein [Gelidibacter pelagius]MBO3100244.1 hypothetical protein [Gelidibacter pelagius]